jgi:hypothetical protein
MNFNKIGRDDPGDVKKELQLKINGSEQAVKFANYKEINQKIRDIQKQNIANKIEFFEVFRISVRHFLNEGKDK